MQISASTKIFLQLQPDLNTQGWINELQRLLAIGGASRIVTNNQIHLTVIHIGALYRIAESLKKYAGIHEEIIYEQAKVLIAHLEGVRQEYAHHEIKLQTRGFDRFGINGDVAVITFWPSPLLEEMHKKGLGILSEFVQSCGISDSEQFLESDANLCHALVLRPHITLAKSYFGPDIIVNEKNILLSGTPIVY